MQALTTIVGLVITTVILVLIRRDHMHVRYAPWWATVALVSLIFGLFPGLIDRIGHLFGIAYPPTLLFVVAIGGLLVKVLSADIERSKANRKILRLEQDMAITEEKLRRLERQQGQVLADKL